MLRPCSLHPETAATSICASCPKAGCDRCFTFEVDGSAACVSCAEREQERGRALGGAMLVTIAAGYLATLAVGCC
jgi:hypothetical protein